MQMTGIVMFSIQKHNFTRSIYFYIYVAKCFHGSPCNIGGPLVHFLNQSHFKLNAYFINQPNVPLPLENGNSYTHNVSYSLYHTCWAGGFCTSCISSRPSW